MRRIHRLQAILLLVLLLLVSQAARAQSTDVSVLFTPASQTATAGSTVYYTATFTNLTATALQLDTVNLNAYVDAVASDVNAANALGNGTLFGYFAPLSPLSLGSNQQQTVSDVLALSLDPSLGAGAYTLEATFTNSVDASVMSNSTPLSLTVTAAVPEAPYASMSVLLLLGSVGLVGQRRRKAL